MCIIIAKPQTAKLPSLDTLANCWKNNSDGAGIAYRAKDGSVIIRKGLMTWADFLNTYTELLERLTDTEVIFHFRITTHGGTCPEYTHPFPISPKLTELKQTYIQTNQAVAHNGIISAYGSKDVSDTAEYIQRVLYPLQRMRTSHNLGSILQVVDGTIDGSRLAWLLPHKGLVYVGDGWREDDGCMYSNSSYLPNYAYWTKYLWENDGDYTQDFGVVSAVKVQASDHLYFWDYHDCSVKPLTGYYLDLDGDIYEMTIKGLQPMYTLSLCDENGVLCYDIPAEVIDRKRFVPTRVNW